MQKNSLVNFNTVAEIVMFNSIKNLFNNVAKNITIMLFMLLPKQVTNVFVTLSILSLINNLRSKKEQTHGFNEKKFKELLDITFEEDIMLLPNKAITWFWNNDFLNSNISLRGKNITVREAISNDDYLYPNIKTITSKLLCNLPFVLKYKLKLKKIKNRLELKHSIVHLFLVQN